MTFCRSMLLGRSMNIFVCSVLAGLARNLSSVASSQVSSRADQIRLVVALKVAITISSRRAKSRIARPRISSLLPSEYRFAVSKKLIKAQARKILDAPKIETLEGEPLKGRALIKGLRDRAILSVGLQVGLRRAEIAVLKVGDLHLNRGYDSLRVQRKGDRRDALAINPQTAARLRAYLDAAGHAGDIDGPL